MTTIPSLHDSTLTVNDKVALLALNRHDVRNALTGTQLANDIVTVVDWVNRSHHIAVLVITGNGSAFSAGGNVKDMAEKSGDFAGDVETLELKYRHGIQRIPKAMDVCDVPIIAAVNGPAIGAGFDLANMCDIRLASNRANFGETFINLGLIPGDGGAWFMQRLIGYQQAAALTFTGEIINADKALAMGIVLAVHPHEDLLPKTMELAQEMAKKPVAALRKTKRLMKIAQRTQLNDFLDICAAFQGMCHQDEAHIKAVNQLLGSLTK